jgi:hypothetical protein
VFQIEDQAMSDLAAVAGPWATLAFLGAFHGANPGMGWLFAVALGLQERSRSAVLRALGPIALGHAISLGVVAAAVVVLQFWTDLRILKTVAALTLIAFGLYRILAPNAHPRWVGMRVTGRDLVFWSFLMATAHGAGLMLVPVLLRLPGNTASNIAHAAAAGPTAQLGHAEFAGSFEALTIGLGSLSLSGELVAVLIHTATMLLVMTLIALLVFEKLGLAVLRRAWINVDRLWAGSLIGMGALTLLT